MSMYSSALSVMEPSVVSPRISLEGIDPDGMKHIPNETFMVPVGERFLGLSSGFKFNKFESSKSIHKFKSQGSIIHQSK